MSIWPAASVLTLKQPQETMLLSHRSPHYARCILELDEDLLGQAVLPFEGCSWPARLLLSMMYAGNELARCSFIWDLPCQELVEALIAAHKHQMTRLLTLLEGHALVHHIRETRVELAPEVAEQHTKEMQQLYRVSCDLGLIRLHRAMLAFFREELRQPGILQDPARWAGFTGQQVAEVFVFAGQDSSDSESSEQEDPELHACDCGPSPEF